MEEARKLSSEAQQQADSAMLEKSTLELETADLRRQCTDLKHKASTLTVESPSFFCAFDCAVSQKLSSPIKTPKACPYLPENVEPYRAIHCSESHAKSVMACKASS